MKKRFKFLLIFLCLLNCSAIAVSQKNYVLCGYVTDKITGEVLIGATVVEQNVLKGTTTNSYGFFSLLLSPGEHTILVSYLGYTSEVININLKKNIRIDFEIETLTEELEEVTVKSDYKTNPLHMNEFSMERLSLKEISRLPSVFGEADIIKAIQLQTGVKTVGDGSSGMFIRGGGSDQNLIIIDEAPVYNPSHLFGLISVFNPDAINHVSLYKSNMPAQYGGRASSVIDCKMKEGSMKEHNFSTGISPFSVSISANGPVKNEISSYFISARKSLVDLLMSPGNYIPLVPAFYDINVKVNSKIGIKNRLFFSIYNGKDRLESIDGYFNKWGNSTATFRWNRNIGEKLFANLSLISSDYDNYLEFKDETRDYKWQTGLKDINIKLDVTYYIKPQNSLRIGVGSIYHKFIPGESVDKDQSIPRINALEHSFYISHNTQPIKWLGIDYGIRISGFQNIGKATWFEYNEFHVPVETKNNSKGIYNYYWCIEPRVSLNAGINNNSSLKFAYARNAQYLQILQNSSLSYTSLETWFPANPNIKPIIVDIFSMGWFHKFNDTYSFEVETYGKMYQNQIDYVDHAKLICNPYIEGEVRTGTSKACGLEIVVKKEDGKFTGNVSYSYSKAFRTIEEINEGMEYSSPYDIPHDFRITGNYQISPKWNISSIWIYMSGRPVTLPIGFYFEGKEPIPIYSDRNSSRFPNYHRLDIAATYTTKKTNKKSFQTVSIGVFNAYARKNPLGYEFVRRPGTSCEIDVYQYTLFSIMPNFSVKFNF